MITTAVAAMNADGKVPSDETCCMRLCSKLQGKTNFFEKRVSEYQKSGVMNSLSSESERKVNRSFSVEVDF